MMHNKPFSLHIDPADFAPATNEEKESLVVMRDSVSFWRDGFRRLRKNKIAMVSFALIVLIMLFAYVLPSFWPYAYEQQTKGAENLSPGTKMLVWSVEYEKDGVLCSYEISAANGTLLSVNKTHTDYGVPYEGEPAGCFKHDEEAAIKTALNAGNADRNTVKNLKAELQRKEQFPFIFGTDKLGRDFAVRLMMGTRISLTVGLICAALVLLVGSTFGAVAGFAGGWIDNIMMRFTDILYTIPDILLIIILAMVLREPLKSLSTVGGFRWMQRVGPNLIAIFIVFVLLYWVGMARITRSQVLVLKESEYVTAARALGAGKGRIIRKHLLTNCIGTLIVTTTLQIPSAIFTESYLSFLGLGVAAPMPSLGSLATDAVKGMNTFPHLLLFPAILISITILVFNLFGDGLRDAFDPKLKN
jgi:oligopeptide transport system permease protein